MRRVLSLLAALALPCSALAQAAAGTIQVPADRTAGKFLGKADCTSPTNTIGLTWTIQPISGQTFTAGGVYKLFATNTAPTGSPAWCDTNTTAGVKFGEAMTELQATQASPPQQAVLTQRILQAAGVGCDATGTPSVYLCVQWYNANGARAGLASTTLTAQFEPAPVPINVSTAPRTNALDVSWAAGSTTGVTIHHYVATATGPDSVPHTGATGDATTSVTVSGLTNGVQYTVTVHSVSQGGNASAESASATGTPIPSKDFWDWYKSQGGVENGGCSTGAAGGLALLGVASLLAFRRRRSR